MNFTLENLGVAYRKAKVDLFYSSHASLLAIAKYESQLVSKLHVLLAHLNESDEDWIKSDDFLGGWTLSPKSIIQLRGAERANGLVFASPIAEWQHNCELTAGADGSSKPKAEFRLMADCSLDFHVLSALWMLHVGCKYDKQLTECSYGNRLRRCADGEINPLSLGSFKPYLKPFRDWRVGGIDAMRTALSSRKKVVALTADVSSFYHKLNPGFMLDDAFNQLLKIELTHDEQRLHRLFIIALQAWARNTPLKQGLPVGLPASVVVANMALIELDRMIERQVVPLYYGRYVDDVLLVMENGAGFRSTIDLWKWLFARSDSKLGWVGERQDQIGFHPEYLKDSQIRFANTKNKVFLLDGEAGQALVDSIANQIHQRASEWRSLPALPASARHVGTDLIAATQSDGEAADNLRKADALTMRRAGFAIKLRDFEAYERDLPPNAWQEHRHAFFQAFIQHVLVLPHFFELAPYMPRVIRLATACEDFEHLSRMIEALRRVSRSVDDCCDLSVKSCSQENQPERSIVLERWNQRVLAAVYESVLAAFPPRLSKVGKQAWIDSMRSLWSELTPGSEFHEYRVENIHDIQAVHARLFSHDLAHMPFRFIGLPKELIAQRGIAPKSTVLEIGEAQQLLPDSITNGNATLKEWARLGSEGLPLGLLFATRPFNLAELFILAKDPFSSASQPAMRSVVLALRGFKLKPRVPQWDKNGVLQIPFGESRLRQTIAVSSWKTEYRSWIASVTRMPDPDLTRYARLTRLVNGLLSQPKGARYFILPELALPAHWFLRLAIKLQGRGISLITGIEYLHAGKGRVRHQVWAALPHDGLGFPSLMVYRQDKQFPALHEEQELQRVGGLELKPDRTWKVPPIIQHGDFRFALLVCSELTNISYRAALRGQVDALFVPEWNQDTETFNALVESSALDIHAYIVQCNDRHFGDSRIRVPSKESWQRDVLRVKGGIDDYCVTGEIDVQALRRFQSSHRSPSTSFKPVPDGFVIARARKVLPSE